MTPSFTLFEKNEPVLESGLKKVLILAYYFPPMGLSGVQRTLKFVKYLPQFGWKPIVLTISPTAYYAYDETLLNELEGLPVEIHRTDTRDITKAAARASGKREFKMPAENTRRFMSMISQSFFIPDNKIGWNSFAIQKASEIIEKNGDIEVIFSTAPPFSSHLIALELRRKYQLPTAVEFRDPWVDNPSHFYLTPFHKRKHAALEETVVLTADKVVSVNRTLKELLVKKYHGKLKHTDVSIIPHGFDEEDFQGLDRSYIKGNKFRLTYSGVFRDDRTPVPLFQGLKALIQKRPEIKDFIELSFTGIFPNEYFKQSKNAGLDGLITTKGYVSHQEAILENLKADVLWATLGKAKNNDCITLGKLFEYVACNRTIFGIMPDGASALFIREANGFIAAPDKPLEIAAKLEILFDLWKKGHLPRPSEDTVQKYNRKRLAEQLSKELGQMITVY
ncbi:MAG: glycosyltransferase [Chloroherpetonaceae bacterium]|nr:glycosyltransferase [Chloroherpetonaceae bacterium]